MKNRLTKKAISVFLAVVMTVTGVLPAMTAFAGDGVEGYYDLQIFYRDTDTIVPKYEEDGETEFKIYMVEGDELQLKYKLIDSVFPDNGHIKWYSEEPTLVDVNQNGKVKAFDSSKGAVVQLWIDNEVKSIPIVGSVAGQALEKVFFNEYIDVETMDTDAIIAIAEAALGSDSIIADNIESYKGDLIDSLRTYLDKVNSNIHCELYDGDGVLVADDVVSIVVQRNDEWYANFLPNGTHITNKSQIPDTVAKGSQVQLYAITTPRRLNFGTVYSVKSSSVFSQGKIVATVDDSGLVKFKNVGTTTIMASPDSKDVVEGLLKFINYFYALENTGVLDTNKAADILIKYIGIDMNRTVLAGILDVIFAVTKIAGDSADPVQLTATAVEIIANLTLQFVYNDTIDFTVVEAQPIEAFDIEGANSAKEGVQIQLSPTNLVPEFGDITDIEWRSSNPNVACVDPKTGVVTALDAGGSLGALSSQTCTIYALSTTNNVERSITFTVTGKTGKYISKAEIKGKSIVGIEDTANYSYSVYPERVSESENLYIQWGIVAGEDEDGNPQYIWASEAGDAIDPDNVAKIDYRGHFTPLTGGKCTIALEAKTGYQLSDGTFYEISKRIATKEVETGIPVENINIGVTGAIGNGSRIGRNETVTINGVKYQYCTIQIGVGNMYFDHGATIKATVYPADATDQTLTWVVDNKNYKKEISSNTQTIDVTQVAAEEHTDKFNIYAVSSDGEVKSNVVTVCITRNYASSNRIDQRSLDIINGKDAQATHSLTFEGSWDGDAYACYDANWYSSDEEIFTVEDKNNKNSDAIIHAKDVGVATLYCVSADGAFVDSIPVTVRPNKQTLQELVDLCDKTIVLRTNFNRDYYKDYMRKLDLAYTVLYEEDMASQTVVDTTAQELLSAFIKVGGFVGITSLDMLGINKTELDNDYITVKVGATSSYKNYSYDFDYRVYPKGAMYSKAVWTSSNSSVIVDSEGVCYPANNDPCSADITCTVVDYNGNTVSDTKHVAFARTVATGVELNEEAIIGAKIGTTRQMTATVLPKNVFGNSSASVGAVTWASSNPEVVTIDENGLMSFLYGGNAIIYCTTADGGYTTSCTVNVTTNYDNLDLLVKQLDDLSLNQISYYPETWAPYIKAKNEARDMIAKKQSSQEEVDAKYNELDTAYKNLKKFVDIQKVELYLDGEPTAEFYQYDLRLLKEGISYKNASLDLNVRLYPNNATYNSATWSSSTSDISVSSDGVCSPTVNKSCYGTITCTVVDSFGKEFSDTVVVSFSYNPVTAVRLSRDTISGAIGTTHQLTCTIEPVGSSLLHIAAADIKDYYWESDDTTVATVDNTGLVRFVGAGSTIVRCVSYDGGVNGECKVSTEGDRTALKEAIERYENVDYTLYEYYYGTEFKKAYDEALNVLGDRSKTQDEIDTATSNLNVAGGNLAEHPYIPVNSISVSYTTQKRSLTNSATQVSSGTVSSSNALSVNLSSGYSNYNDYNDVILRCSASPSNSMFRTVNWEIVENNGMVVTNNQLASLTMHPSDNNRSSNAYAIVRAVYTDHFGKKISREIAVVMSDTTCTGLNVTETRLEILGSAEPIQLHYNTTGTAGYIDRVLFSSTDEDVAVVDANGFVYPVDAGTCTIVAKTLDGGYTKYVTVTVQTDFSKLAAKVAELELLINDVKDGDQFTAESLDALSKEVEACRVIVDENKATQREVNAAYNRLMATYNALTGYIPATGVSLYLRDDQKTITEVNPGFIRYNDNAVNNAYVLLGFNVAPADGMYESIRWTSSSSVVTVDESGKVTNTNAYPNAAEITVTITTIYGDKYSDSVYVSFVRYPVTDIEFGTDLLYGAPNKTKQIPVTLTTDAKLDTQIGNIRPTPSVTNCLFKSNDETIAIVDGDGNVSFRKQGKTTITVTSIDGGISKDIPVQTTWDTSALEEAVLQAEALPYMDYEYEYGMQLKADREAGRVVMDNPNASQQAIDAACTKLTETLTVIEEHKFVLPEVSMTINDEQIVNGMTYQADEGVLRVNVGIAGNMYKSFQVTHTDEDNVTVNAGNNQLVITKTEVGNDGAVTLGATVVDTYDRETTYSYTIYIVDEMISISSISITLDGEPVDSVTKSGYSLAYRDFAPFTLGYKANAVNTAAPIDVSWSSTNADYITIDNTGTVNLTTLGKAKNTNTANIICTVTNADGTVVTAKIPVTIKR